MRITTFCSHWKMTLILGFILSMPSSITCQEFTCHIPGRWSCVQIEFDQISPFALASSTWVLGTWLYISESVLKFCSKKTWATSCLSQLMILLENDLSGFLFIGQVSFKNYRLGKKIYLSWARTTQGHFFWASLLRNVWPDTF